MVNKEKNDYNLIEFDSLEAETLYDVLQAYYIYNRLNYKQLNSYDTIQQLLKELKNANDETLNLTLIDTILFAKSLHFISNHKEFFNIICKVGKISYKNMLMINYTIPKLSKRVRKYNRKYISHSVTTDDINRELDKDINIIKKGNTRKALDNIFKNLNIDSKNKTYYPYDLISTIALDTNKRKPLGKYKDLFVLKSVVLGTIHFLANAPEDDDELLNQFNLLRQYKNAQYQGYKYIICNNNLEKNKTIVTPVNQSDGIQFIRVMKLVNKVLANK